VARDPIALHLAMMRIDDAKERREVERAKSYIARAR
jgi:hypothetical protein